MKGLSEPQRLADALAGHLGVQVRDKRQRRHWTLRELAARTGLSASLLQWLEAGHPASLESYVRVASALGLRPDFDLIDVRRRGPVRADDPVHAAMGEFLAGRLTRLGLPIALDEPYQHYQFAGRADLLAWSIEDRALLRIENRTRLPNLQEAFGSCNAKRRYLAAGLADRLGVRGGFATVTHAMVYLWSAEVLHAVRLHAESFRAVCPDSAEPFAAWLAGRPPADLVSSSLVILDPLAAGRERAFVGRPELETVRPRHRGYLEALEALRRAGRA